MKRKTIELSREVILLADSSKVGKNARGFITPAHKLQRLITDNAASAGEIDRLRQLGVIVDLV
jgi:DeoR/GlpR family transcriptional regulator of sugar metabolism